MTNPFLASIVPDSNTLSLPFAQGAAATSLLEMAYAPDSGFVGAFSDVEGEESWVRRAARYMDDEFISDTPGKIKWFRDVLPSLSDDGAGKCLPNFRHALDIWIENGRQGVEPYSSVQSTGSCVDASCGEHECTLFGWRAARPEYNEVWKYASAWYKYAGRGYCGQGWNGSGIATVALRVGCAFRIPYTVGPNSVDFTDNRKNEQIVSREWCRSGIPSWMADYTQQFHSYEDGAITRFEGGVKELRALFAAGGIIHTSGRRTSGGPKPFTIGSVGAHMQSGVGCDDSDEFRKFCQDVIKVKARDDDFPVIMNQTWGDWSGACADEFWPDTWGKMPQGAWVWWASDVISKLSCDYAWLPRVKGFPSDTPVPPTPPGPVPPISGELYVEQAGDRIAIRGQLERDGHLYIAVPSATKGRYKMIPKPSL